MSHGISAVCQFNCDMAAGCGLCFVFGKRAKRGTYRHICSAFRSFVRSKRVHYTNIHGKVTCFCEAVCQMYELNPFPENSFKCLTSIMDPGPGQGVPNLS